MSLFRSTVKNTYRLTVELEGPGTREEAIEALFAVGFFREHVKKRHLDYGGNYAVTVEPFSLGSSDLGKVEPPSSEDDDDPLRGES